MKKLPIFLSFFLLTIGQMAVAQVVEMDEITPQETPTPEVPEESPALEKFTKQEVNIYESNESMSKGLQNAIIVEVPSSNEKLVEGVWKKFIKDYGGKTKRTKGNRNESTTTGAEVVGINGVNSLTIYSKAISGTSGDIEMCIWFDMGEEFLESNRKSQYDEAELMLQKFAHEVRIENTRGELKVAEKTLKKYEGNLKTLQRQNEGYHKDIANYEKKIEEAKDNIITNDEQQVSTNEKIELQMQLVDEIDRRLRKLKKQ
ncbi:MAG: hypothetical protein AAFZ15_13040 [Bacteroidota bacterium]